MPDDGCNPKSDSHLLPFIFWPQMFPALFTAHQQQQRRPGNPGNQNTQHDINLPTSPTVIPPPPLHLPHHDLYTDRVLIRVRNGDDIAQFAFPRATLDFWSPAVRNLLDRLARGQADKEQSVDLLNTDAETFTYLQRFWQTLDLDPVLTLPGGGVRITSRDDQTIPMLYKLWVLANFFGGPSLVVRDLCMARIYADHTAKTGRQYPSANAVRFLLLHMEAEFQSKNTTSPDQRAAALRLTPLVRFLISYLGSSDVYDKLVANLVAGGDWALLMDDFPYFRGEIFQAVVSEDGTRRIIRSPDIEPLRHLSSYVAALGDVTAGWHSRRDERGWR